MNRFLFLLTVLLISTYSLFGQSPMEEDPNLLWQTTDPLGYSGFVIHPNGNIIAYRNTEFFEIDGNTGEQIRAFPTHSGFTEILSISQSPDGKYFAAIYAGGGDSVIIFITDYKTGENYRKIRDYGDNACFFPDSKRLLITTFDRGHPNASLSIYNLEDEIFQNFGAGFITEGFHKLAISNDGKYFATGGIRTSTDIKGDRIYNVHLRLWDAQTLKPIKELAKIGGNFEVRSIKFSPDGKYVGFNHSFYDVMIYDTENYDMVNQFKGSGAFSLFSNNLIGMYANPGIVLQDFKTNERIFETSNFSYGAYYFVHFNTFNNTLVYGGGILRALDLKKILTSVPELPKKNTFSANFNKDTLILTGLNSVTGNINITINDITGRVIRKLEYPVSNTELRIPLKLPNGTYLVHIQDGSKEYSSKFLVTE